MATRTQINTYLLNNREQLEAIQENYRLLNRKYKQYKRGELHEALEIHEYVRPNGGIGYVIFLHAEESVDRYIKLYLFNNQTFSLYQDWSLVVQSEG
jgi:hypothetical protein